MVYERKYGKVSASIPFAEFVHNVYLPWAKANKRSSGDDERHAKVFCRHFGNKSLSEIDYQMIEEFKVERMNSITRHGRTRKPASVNRELAILSGVFRMAVDYDEINRQPVPEGTKATGKQSANQTFVLRRGRQTVCEAERKSGVSQADCDCGYLRRTAARRVVKTSMV